MAHTTDRLSVDLNQPLSAAVAELERAMIARALETSGGRVIAATGLGSTLSQAAAKSREAAAAIVFDGKQYRSDIGA